MSSKRVVEAGAFKHGRITLSYEAKFRPGRPLVVIFPAVDTIPARCQTSYYGLGDTLDASVVHLRDNFGAHGSYLLRIAGEDAPVRETLVAFLRQMMEEAGVGPQQLWLVGTSKGATTALCAALMLGTGRCIAGEPQVRLGDFLYPGNWRDLPSMQAISYAMMGRIDEADRDPLNEVVLDLLRETLPGFNGSVDVFYGLRSGYYPYHISYLETAVEALPNANYYSTGSRKLSFRQERFATHNDVVPVFLERVKKQIGVLQAEDEESGGDARAAG